MTDVVWVALALLAWALVSARAPRWPLTMPIVFVAVGVAVSALGSLGSDVPESTVGLVGEVALAVVLFGDAARIDLGWAATTTVGMAIGLLVGAAAVDYRTGIDDLVIQGAVTGAIVGLAQATRLLPLGARAYAWPFALSGLWALGWTTTTVVGVDVERQWATFGASGAILSTVGTGLVLLTRKRVDDRRPSS